MYLEGNRHWVPLVCDYSSHYCLITAVKWPSSPGGGGGGTLGISGWGCAPGTLEP